MSDWNTFVKWEMASRETIDFKMIYVDIACGDILAGLLLSQIVYWNLPGKDGRSKLRVQKENKLWLARKHSEWHTEIRMSEDQVRRALKVLQALQLVEVKLFKFDGAPTNHICLNRNVLAHAIKNQSVLGCSPDPFGPEPNSIWEQTQIHLGCSPEPLTETTYKDYNKDLNTPFNPPTGDVSEIKKVLCGRCSRFKPNTQDLEGKNYCLTCLPYEFEERRIIAEVAMSTMPQKQIQQPTPQLSAPPPLPPGFDGFWQNYPTKVAKPAALKAWKKLKPSQALQDTIIRDVAIRMVNDRRWIDGFIPNPATYLNQHRWEDEILNTPQPRPKAMSQEERNREVFANYAAKKGVKINGLN